MKQSLILTLPAFSINRMHYRDKRHKTQEAQDWSTQVLHQLSFDDNAEALRKLRDKYDPTQHAYQISFIFYYPKSKFITSKGYISSRTHDLTNVEKPLLDLICLPTYFDKPHPYGAKNLNIDDKYFVDVKSSKRISEDSEHRIEVKIKIIDLKNLYLKCENKVAWSLGVYRPLFCRKSQ